MCTSLLTLLLTAAIGVVVSLAPGIDDETCLLQARADTKRRSPQRHADAAADTEKAAVNWGDDTECRSWATNNKKGEMPLACVSVMLRASVLLPPRGPGTVADLAGATKKEKAAFDRQVLTPNICSALKINHCHLQLLGAGQFDRLRAQHMPGTAVPASDQLKISFEAGPLTSLDDTVGGKSGAGFLKTADGRFIIKSGLSDGKRMDEVANLYKMTHSKPLLVDHLEANPHSLLNRIFGLVELHLGDSFRTSKSKSLYIILEDATHLQDVAMNKIGEFIKYNKYDLKERPGVNAALFTDKEGGTMKADPADCGVLDKQLKADTAFLKAHDMIDYSLFVGAATYDAAANRRKALVMALPACPQSLSPPLCLNSQDKGQVQYTVSIIDYLNDFNWFKEMENKLPGDKWGKFDDWGDKLVAVANQICPLA